MCAGKMSTIVVFVTRSGGRSIGLRIPQDHYVFDLVDAVIAKLQLGCAADVVLLRHPPGGDGELGAILDPTDSLNTAGVHNESRLVVEVMPTSAVGECSARR